MVIVRVGVKGKGVLCRYTAEVLVADYDYRKTSWLASEYSLTSLYLSFGEWLSQKTREILGTDNRNVNLCLKFSEEPGGSLPEWVSGILRGISETALDQIPVEFYPEGKILQFRR